MAPRRMMPILCAAALLLFADPVAHAATRSIEKSAANPEMTGDELKNVQALIEQMAAAFVAGDDKACMRLFAPNAEGRDRIAANLQNEFRQTRYLKFEVVQVLAEDTLKAGVHSVEARLRIELINRDRHPENQLPIKNSTSETFVVGKMDDGRFALLHSPYFDNLGLRQGMGLVVEGLLAVMLLCALLAFWVWMGWEAWRARPRETLWRVTVCVPLIGAFAFFFGHYLPRVLRKATRAVHD